MNGETEYEILYQLGRRLPGENDFTEIGFGASSAWTTPGQCAHILMSDVQNYGWETEADMPDPDEIKHAIESEEA